jgi:hypothetical protein
MYAAGTEAQTASLFLKFKPLRLCGADYNIAVSEVSMIFFVSVFFFGAKLRDRREVVVKGENPNDSFFSHFFQGGPTSTSRTVIPPAILSVLDGGLGGER